MRIAIVALLAACGSDTITVRAHVTTNEALVFHDESGAVIDYEIATVDHVVTRDLPAGAMVTRMILPPGLGARPQYDTWVDLSDGMELFAPYETSDAPTGTLGDIHVVVPPAAGATEYTVTIGHCGRVGAAGELVVPGDSPCFLGDRTSIVATARDASGQPVDVYSAVLDIATADARAAPVVLPPFAAAVPHTIHLSDAPAFLDESRLTAYVLADGHPVFGQTSPISNNDASVHLPDLGNVIVAADLRFDHRRLVSKFVRSNGDALDLDGADFLPQVVDLVVDGDAVRPTVTWSLEPGHDEPESAILGLQDWTVFANGDRREIQLPELPDELAVPTFQPAFPYLYLFDSTAFVGWTDPRVLESDAFSIDAPDLGSDRAYPDGYRWRASLYWTGD